MQTETAIQKIENCGLACLKKTQAAYRSASLHSSEDQQYTLPR